MPWKSTAVGAGWFKLNGTEHVYARGGYGICLLCYSKRPRVKHPLPHGWSCPVSCPFRRRVYTKFFTVTHKRLTVDGSRVLQTDRGLGSKVGGWGEKNLRVVLLSIPPRPQKYTQYYPPRSHDYSPISLFCLPEPGSCSFNGVILQLRLKALFLFIIVVVMESQ